jgi:hypothetical protein
VFQDRLPGGAAGPAISVCGLLAVAGLFLVREEV